MFVTDIGRSDPLATLNPDQRRAAAHEGSNLLIIAGAGTGKTKTISARVARLIEDGVSPERVLLLTFTRRAAAEMLSRIGGATDPRLAERVCGGTFHSVANRLLRRHGRAAGLPADFTVLDPADSADLFGLLRTEAGHGERGRRFPRKETIASIYSRVVNAQERLETVIDEGFPWCADHTAAIKELFGAYTNHKRRQQVLDYDDLLLFWRGLTTSSVGPQLREEFDHILIDEYQDTNTIQTEIVKGMARTDGETPTVVCAVGDDAQAIYGFRAATVTNLWNFTDDFSGTAVVTLEQNYRSSQAILDVANRVLELEIPTGGGERVTASRFPKRLWSDRSIGAVPRLVTAADDLDEARRVVDTVLDGRERGIDLRDQAILFRTGHHADAVEIELVRRDVPYRKYGGISYLEAAHVKDLLCLLRVLDNPNDILAWHRILGAMDGVGPATLRRVHTELGLDQTDLRTTLEDGEGNERRPDDPLRRFLAGRVSMPSSASAQTDALREAWAACLEDATPAIQIDQLSHFCALVFPQRYENAAARLADLAQLASTAAGYRSRSQFLTELTLDPPSKTSERAGPPHLDDDWLTLSTIHSAKGMEWRAVHLVHAADGNIPSDMALGDADGMAEELRLLYVALTRARDELTVTVPLRFPVERRSHDDHHVYAQLSRFLEPARDLFDSDELMAADEALAADDVSVTVNLTDEVDVGLFALWDD